MGEIDVGRKVAQEIPPGIFWRSQVFVDHPTYLKFNVSLTKAALVGIYGRRGLPPSHTQVSRLGVASPVRRETNPALFFRFVSIVFIRFYPLSPNLDESPPTPPTPHTPLSLREAS